MDKNNYINQLNQEWYPYKHGLGLVIRCYLKFSQPFPGLCGLEDNLSTHSPLNYHKVYISFSWGIQSLILLFMGL